MNPISQVLLLVSMVVVVHGPPHRQLVVQQVLHCCTGCVVTLAFPSAGWDGCELSGTTVHDRHLREGGASEGGGERRG